ncbi:glycoside hydrolase family 3 C-terminal domain-containing protein [Clostridium estertheticum]|uniref:Glycosyl hydrolase n=1 Tax=Clostridium estertheticum subsp. estertheticum TaxID=1552 RepID=A0A1J0GGX0_9CLOT|nr:glycoside hydrolase family 3 C-terminal domain-containing protein [Clostridium estertheticum]APC40150.1 glycosyl hydrolase [Clostridium estertheticum subsp. estertheticum]MBU3170372.1 glycoside hydrolase family 3 C-terminal domain-containing protein [Clostridium estertheticum]MBZ9618064.1 glycoside hydrolase family 3 C-terminal domain-containing protein [Clostridium estertheticum subsp. laramiense]WAG73720.1 glycoside hydrolase family 3 C-terminal domain-containing protein [Clostridium ester
MKVIPKYKNENLSFEQRAKDLVSKMTLFEKVSQMTYNSAAIDRLCIPSYNWWNEALHGVARAGVATMFPQAIGMAATFDEELIYQVACVISTEGRAKYNESQRKNDHDIYKGLTFWAPNINIFRDPRWGRGHETYGEDPYLTGRLGVAFIKGLQGNDKRYMKSAACAKHFAVHSGPEAKRHSFNAVVSKKDLRETYLPAFKEAVKEANVEAVMGAYNRTNGEPCCGSKTLLNDILRDEWGFKGHVTSDCWAIKDFHEGHGITSNAVESVALAVNNGCDLNCGNMYLNLYLAYKEGMVTEETIDKSVIRLMNTRMKLGMFDDPTNVPFAKIPYEKNDSKEHLELALDVSRRTMVLLKNEDNMLPLNKNKIKSIAVIGPNANSRDALIGNYYGTSSKYVTVLEGFQQVVNPDTRVYYAQGCHLFKDKVENLAMPEDRIVEAVSAAQRSDVVVMCLGLDANIEGEEGDDSNAQAGGDKMDLNLPGLQQKLLEEVYKTGKPIILVLLSGSALAINWADEHIPAIVQAWYPSAQGGNAIASLIFGEYSPSGKLPVTFYKSTQELPDFEDYAMKNRTYRYMENEALYPFGYGLSYSKFEYSNLRISKTEIEVNETVNLSVTVKNIGKYESDETVQLYLKDVEASVVVPKYQLKGIKKVSLKPSEEKEVSFELTPRQMALIDDEGKCILEPGLFEVFVGGSQPDKRSKELTGDCMQKSVFNVKGESIVLEY